MRYRLALEGRKIAGTPYGGTWQARRGGRLRDMWVTWREERGVREFDRFRLALVRMRTDQQGVYDRVWPRG